MIDDKTQQSDSDADKPEMKLFLKMNGPFEDVALVIAKFLPSSFTSQLRDGLNLGGGDYYKFSEGKSEILLVQNDLDHSEVFVQERQDFPYYCYVWEGNPAILNELAVGLSKNGFTCELAEIE